MRSSYDLREFFRLAWLAGTVTYAFAIVIVLIAGLVGGHIPISWTVALVGYPLSVVLFIIGPALMWLFFRFLILVSSMSVRRPS